MASGEAEAVPDPPQSKTVVLKVFIHCPGCKKKVQRIVKRINGVSTCEVDAPHNKVTVTGDVDADYLIKKLLKSGKQADLWPEPKNPNPNTAQKKDPHPPKEASDKSHKNPPSETPTPKEVDTKPAKEPQKPNKSAKEEDGPKPDDSKTQTQSSSEAPPAKIPASGEEAAGSTGVNKKEKKGQNSKPADDKREADSAAPPPPPPDARMHQMYLPPPPAPAIVSYNTAQPSTSHAYYAAAPMPHMMSQGYAPAPVPHMMPQGYAAAPVPHMMPQGYAAAPMANMSPQGYAYAPYYPLPPPQQLPLEDLYYGPPGSRLSSPPRDQYEYAVFNDENANSCTVM